MILTLVTVGVLLGVGAVYVLIAPSKDVVLAGESTVVGLSDASAETLATGRHQAPALRTDWHLTTVSALSDAEELLDLLEYQGYAERELVVLGNSCFAVRWR
ncbi:MAG: hypothetical protein ACKODX_03660 [Gemmata sp.]